MRRIMTFNKEIKNKLHIYQIPKHLSNSPEYMGTPGILIPWPNIIVWHYVDTQCVLHMRWRGVPKGSILNPNKSVD